MDNIEIDWDVVVYRYDPKSRMITISNWHDKLPPLTIATVHKPWGAPPPKKTKTRRATSFQNVWQPYLETAVQKLVDLANEKLAIDLLAKDTAAK
jgi:hypothetical protein